MGSPPLFRMPPREVLEPNGPDDPLPYYYMPLVGRIFRARMEQALGLLEPPYGKILEVGFGSGVMLPSLSRMGDHVFGIDLQSDAPRVQRAMAGLGVRCRLKQGSLMDYEFPAEGFDLIVAVSVLEHIRDLAPVFAKFNRLLKSDGQLLVGMPRVDRFMEKAFAVIGFENIEKYHVTDRKTCISQASPWFRLSKSAHLPSWLPDCVGIYFNMLFEKRSGIV